MVSMTGSPIEPAMRSSLPAGHPAIAEMLSSMVGQTCRGIAPCPTPCSITSVAPGMALGALSAGRPDQWIQGPVHDQRRQPHPRERLGPIRGSEHGRLLTEFAGRVVWKLIAPTQA